MAIEQRRLCSEQQGTQLWHLTDGLVALEIIVFDYDDGCLDHACKSSPYKHAIHAGHM
jgi:hypothetical protein